MTRKRQSKCHDCPYREMKGVCKACRGEDDALYDEATLRKKFARLRAKQRGDQ